MMSHAHFAAHTDRAQRALRLLDLSKTLRRHRRAVRQTRRQAGRRRLLPSWNPTSSGPLADFGLREAHNSERREHALLRAGGRTWPMAVEIIRVRSIDYGREP